MSVIPGDIETEAQPPMTLPLRHFVLGFAFLIAGSALGIAQALDAAPAFATAAHRHLLLLGWVCLTIMGAMTQFVPVWSGVSLHSRRLAGVQLWLVAAGVAGLVAAFLGLGSWLFPVAGATIVAGLWTFVYNIGRTLARVDELDVTERHFAAALGFFILLSVAGFVLAADLAVGVLSGTSVTRASLVGAHVTLAVFGAVLTTVVGALYQLATMFTQTELHGIDRPLQRFETAAYPVGVLLLAAGRLVSSGVVARLGGLLVAFGLLAVAPILGRRLYETRVEWTPMLSRYAVLTVALVAWGALAIPAWLTDPLARARLLGAPDADLLLVLGVVGFVVLGTLYHIVPFIVWVHRYSDRLGFEQVPMIDDLYDDRLAAADCWLIVSGVVALVAGDLLTVAPVSIAGSALFSAGALVFVANMLLVLRRHSPHSLGEVVGVVRSGT